ncbi:MULTISPECIES: hypothetical protein [Providencia]|uniref:hypothetical protein n=1 Tax=Providencia TaxID=586 RepID=UPI0024813CFB|nr:hypothetical protein [Providencia rettgeri]MDU7494266.1 hypothetical protein [Providencia rettgeri]HEM8306842.1 hypothetical protein [Providencia rettgeri]
MQFYEPEHGSGDASNIREYGFAFIETDAENALDSEISQKNQQRQISDIEFNEEESTLRREMEIFIKNRG